MDVDGSRVDVRVVRPYGFEQPLAREDPAGMLEEMLEQPKFGRAERDRAAAAANPMRGDVHLDVGIGELLAGKRRPDPAKHRRDARDQLRGLNGLVT